MQLLLVSGESINSPYQEKCNNQASCHEMLATGNRTGLLIVNKP